MLMQTMSSVPGVGTDRVEDLGGEAAEPVRQSNRDGAGSGAADQEVETSIAVEVGDGEAERGARNGNDQLLGEGATAVTRRHANQGAARGPPVEHDEILPAISVQVDDLHDLGRGLV